MSERSSDGDLLVADDVRKEFGGLIAVNDLTFTIPKRGIVSLIGPNGAGKTTFFNALTGLYRVTSGRILFDGHDVTNKPPHAITKLGVGRTFQNIRLFPQMTAMENVLVGMHARLKGGILGSILGTPRVRREEREAREKARELLRFSGLRGVDEELAESLSYGDQRRLEVARALATEPKLLLLDEPMAGMGPEDSARMVRFLLGLKRRYAILLVEHDMDAVFALADRISVLVYGRVIATDDADGIRANAAVREAYLGEEDETA
jgi:branched-chain amino acid transport system ATP-binding protein